MHPKFECRYLYMAILVIIFERTHPVGTFWCRSFSLLLGYISLQKSKRQLLPRLLLYFLLSTQVSRDIPKLLLNTFYIIPDQNGNLLPYAADQLSYHANRNHYNPLRCSNHSCELSRTNSYCLSIQLGPSPLHLPAMRTHAKMPIGAPRQPRHAKTARTLLRYGFDGPGRILDVFFVAHACLL